MLKYDFKKNIMKDIMNNKSNAIIVSILVDLYILSYIYSLFDYFWEVSLVTLALVVLVIGLLIFYHLKISPIAKFCTPGDLIAGKSVKASIEFINPFYRSRLFFFIIVIVVLSRSHRREYLGLIEMLTSTIFFTFDIIGFILISKKKIIGFILLFIPEIAAILVETRSFSNDGLAESSIILITELLLLSIYRNDFFE